MYGPDLMPLWRLCQIIFFAMLIGIIVLAYKGCKKSVIEIDHRIEPTVKLIIKDNKVDTLFIYKK